VATPGAATRWHAEWLDPETEAVRSRGEVSGKRVVVWRAPTAKARVLHLRAHG
jgi:hypothetical protein